MQPSERVCECMHFAIGSARRYAGSVFNNNKHLNCIVCAVCVCVCAVSRKRRRWKEKHNAIYICAVFLLHSSPCIKCVLCIRAIIDRRHIISIQRLLRCYIYTSHHFVVSPLVLFGFADDVLHRRRSAVECGEAGEMCGEMGER